VIIVIIRHVQKTEPCYVIEHLEPAGTCKTGCITTNLDTAREGVVEAAREGALEEVVDQMSVEAWRGSPWSSTSNCLLALSSSKTLLPANLHSMPYSLAHVIYVRSIVTQDKARELLAMLPSNSIRHVYVTEVMSAHLCQLQQHQCPEQMGKLQTKTSKCISLLFHQAQKHGLTQGG